MIRPTLDIELSGPAADLSPFRTRALVDTGAPICIFPAGAAEALGFEIGRWDADARTVHILGRPWMAEFHVVGLEIPEFQGYGWEAEVAFLIDDVVIPYGLLGQAGFLDHWTVTFHFYGRYFVVERPDDFESRLPTDPESMARGSFDSEWDRPRAD